MPRKPKTSTFDLKIKTQLGKTIKAGGPCSDAEAVALYILVGADARPGSPPSTRRLIAARDRFIRATEKYIAEAIELLRAKEPERRARKRSRRC